MTVEEIKAYIVANTPDGPIALAQAQAESGWQPRYIFGPDRSSAGAMGLYQFLPGTFAQYGSGDPFNPIDSINARNNYMSYLLGIAGGDYAKALASYNAGEGRIILGYTDRAGTHHNGLVQDYGENWLAHAPPETKGYVAKILGNQTNFFRLILKTLKSATKGDPQTGQK